MNKAAIWPRNVPANQDQFPVKMILCFLLILAGPVFGQIVPGPEDLYREAKEYMLAGEYQEALPVLINLQEKEYSGASISYQIGECYLNLQGQKTKAVPYLKEAAKMISMSYSGDTLNENAAPLKTLLFLGIAYRIQGDFTQALSSFTAYLDGLDRNDNSNRSLAQYHIDRCLNAQELIAAPTRILCDTLPDMINTIFSNYNPVISSDEKQLFFMDQLKFYDAVMHSIRQDTSWQNPDNLTPRIKSDGDHVLTGISADGSLLLLTYYDPYMGGEICMSEFLNGEWTSMTKLNDKINTRFHESHASFSPNGKYIYFTSDRKGGFGGLDIYRSARDDHGNWGVAENLGPLVNSPYNEESPFLTSDGKVLFFSSQGHYNMGGYDIFMSSQQGEKWLPPVNIGYPLNTTDDDLFFFPLGPGNLAYQARMQAGSGQQDIVRYTILSFGHPARYTVTGRVSQHTEPGLEPEKLAVSFVDNVTQDTVALQDIARDGTFTQKLPAGSYTLGFGGNDMVYLYKKLDIPVYFPQDELVFNAEVIIPGRQTREVFLIQDIRFGFDRSSIDESSRQYLDKVIGLMLAYPGLQLHIKGYADAIGNETYNMKLSLLRANAVAAYLSRNGNLSGRISVEAYGEKNPVALNQNQDGQDNPFGRMYNRRVELTFDHLPDGISVSSKNDLPDDLRVR